MHIAKLNDKGRAKVISFTTAIINSRSI